MSVHQLSTKTTGAPPPKSTDAPGSAPAHVITCKEDIARVPPNRIHCGYCALSFPDTLPGLDAYRTHSCKDPLGRSYEPLKEAAARGRRLAREQLNFPVDDCAMCGKPGRPGESHTCAPKTGNDPNSIEAVNRRNRLAALKADLAALEQED